MSFTPNAEVTAMAERIADALAALPVGKVLSYAALSRIAGRAARSSDYILQRGLRLAEQRTGAIFDNVRGQGYCRLRAAQIPSIGKRSNTRIRNCARKTRKRLEGVRENLTAGEVATVAAQRSHFAMLEGLAQEAQVRAASNAIEGAKAFDPSAVAESTAALMRAK